jgi:hypothetical protein
MADAFHRVRFGIDIAEKSRPAQGIAGEKPFVKFLPAAE